MLGRRRWLYYYQASPSIAVAYDLCIICMCSDFGSHTHGGLWSKFHCKAVKFVYTLCTVLETYNMTGPTYIHTVVKSMILLMKMSTLQSHPPINLLLISGLGSSNTPLWSLLLYWWLWHWMKGWVSMVSLPTYLHTCTCTCVFVCTRHTWAGCSSCIASKVRFNTLLQYYMLWH